MTTQALTVLTCNGCGSEADNRFPIEEPDDIEPWMHANGWQDLDGRDLCPACVMDHDAAGRP
jgi:hypothetical protein